MEAKDFDDLSKFDDLSRVGIVHSQEFWNEYLLEDGHILRLKIGLIKVRVKDNLRDEEGNPVYAVKTQLLMDVERGQSKGITQPII